MFGLFKQVVQWSVSVTQEDPLVKISKSAKLKPLYFSAKIEIYYFAFHNVIEN